MSPSSNGATAQADTAERPLLPHSPEAEQAVLGCILIDPTAFYEVATVLEPDDFFQQAHGMIYKAIRTLYGDRVAVDMLTLGELLRQRGVEQIRGVEIEAVILDLIGSVPSSVHALDYARIVESAAVRRRLIRAGMAIANLGHDNTKGVNTILADSEQTLFSVTDRIATKGIVSADIAMRHILDLVTQRREDGGKMVGLASGFADIDHLLRGMKAGQLITMAGRPGMGKTMLEGMFALNVARSGVPVARFTLEMTAESLFMRAISYTARVPVNAVEAGQLNAEEYARFVATTGELSRLPMYVDDTSGLSLAQLSAKARRMKAEHDIGFLTVDYIGLMSVEHSYGNRSQDVGQISRGLKKLAKDLKIPILAISQLNRGVENRQDKRPMMSDLRDSGEIEQDSDAILMLYRDAFYHKEESTSPNVIECNIIKNRNGPTGVAELYFNGQYMQVANLERRPLKELVL